ncbi:hypothetical protein GQ55_8G177400 [Panicum hallii var. hallii]|uniref:Uncharacterized protein n=1 Tax=Panicum hallii var. hallii TaxID=1504633 RepID=A0A2T7CNP4_9POAL|nr:hypothetical protein GQ55_8G177400 [Panicum hallii var. hallii]
MENVVHGTLICSASILQTKSHDHILEQTHRSRYSEHGFVYILRGHKNLVITGVTIHETQDFVTSNRIDQCLCNRHWVLIFRSSPVEVSEVHVNSPSAVLLLYRTSAFICRARCWNGRNPLLRGSQCSTMRLSNPGISV